MEPITCNSFSFSFLTVWLGVGSFMSAFACLLIYLHKIRHVKKKKKYTKDSSIPLLSHIKKGDLDQMLHNKVAEEINKKIKDMG